MVEELVVVEPIDVELVNCELFEVISVVCELLCDVDCADVDCNDVDCDNVELVKVELAELLSLDCDAEVDGDWDNDDVVVGVTPMRLVSLFVSCCTLMIEKMVGNLFSAATYLRILE